MITCILLFSYVTINRATVSFTEHLITNTENSAYDTSVVDINLDGYLDIVVTGLNHHGGTSGEVRWYKNDGHNVFPTYYTITVDGGLKIDTADYDADGYPDVVVADYGQDALYLYCSGGNPTSVPWTRYTVTTGWDVATAVYASDIDKDGDMDVVGVSPGSTNKLGWFENTGSHIFISHTIDSSAISPHSLAIGDFNNDGWTDVVCGWGSSGKSIYWYMNDGNPTGVPWSRYQVSVYGGVDQPMGLFVSDINSDGWNDVVCSATDENSVLWFENDGTPGTGTWTKHTLATNFTSTRDCYAEDIDGDRDIDILASAGTCVDHCVAWWENTDGTGTTWIKHKLLTGTITTSSDIYSKDIDQDTDNDIFVCSYDSNTVLWFESTIASPPPPLPTISFISINGDGNRTTIFTPNPTFKWTTINDTIYYQLQISKNSVFTDLVVDLKNINIVTYFTYYSESSGTSTFTLPLSNALPEIRTYYCRVRALTNTI